MCYICNCTADSNSSLPGGFNNHFLEALRQMKYAAKSMLIMSQNPAIDYLGKEKALKQSKHYDKMHKKMARLIKDWANIEHQREITTYNHLNDNQNQLPQ